jgi:hypothetical protein
MGPPGTSASFDNRQKYLLFVNTCSEKEVIARRVGMELAHLHPEPPAVRVFDAGMGDGTLLTRVLREMHHRFPTLPFYVVGKEISLEDTRLSLDKMPDRFHEHPATVLVVTNMYYTEAPWLAPNQVSGGDLAGLARGGADGQYGGRVQRADCRPRALVGARLAGAAQSQDGQSRVRAPGGARAVPRGLRFLLDDIVPRQGRARADYDLVIASQTLSRRVPVQFKASRVVGPLARALRPAGG